MYTRYLVLIAHFCFSCFSAVGQEELIDSRSTPDHFGTFAMGQSPDAIYSDISLRTDELGLLLERAADYPLILTVTRHDRISRYGTAPDYVQLELGGKNEPGAVPIYRIDTNFRNPKIRSGRLFLLGNPVFSAAQKRKVRWLDWDVLRGPLPDLSAYPNLETLFSQKAFYGLPLPPKNAQVGGTLGFEFIYMGDLHFWSSLYKGQSLSTIHLDFPENHPGWGSGPSDLYHLDAPTDSLLELPLLRSLHMDGLPYFPVCFSRLQKLDHLVLEGPQEPELINIAVIMYSYDKDTSTGNWNRLLQKADLSAKVVIPGTGSFETYYKSGKPLCKGAFVGGKPDGNWRFWHENGKLAQERFYRNGRREGTWTFLVEDQLSIGSVAIDTFRILTYSDDRLVKRIDFNCGLGFYQRFGLDNEHGFEARQITTWSIDRTGPGEAAVTKTIVVINNDPDELAGRHVYVTPTSRSYFGDTIMGSSDIWEWKKTGWSYEYDLMGRGCNDLYARELKGNPGKTAYYGSGHSIHVSWSYYEPDNLRYSELIETINLQDCYWERLKWVKDHPTHPPQLEESLRAPIGPGEWPCREQH